MSTTAAPYGAQPINSLSSSGSFSGKMRAIPIATTYGTSIFNGDFVKLVAGGGVEKDTGTSTMTPVGIFMGCAYTDPTTGQYTNSNYWPAGNAATDAVAFVLDDPNVLFRMQANGSITADDRGQNAAVIQTAGTAQFGRSRNAVNATTATTAAMPLRIIDFTEDELNTAGDAYTDVICKFNAGHMYANTTGI